MACWSILWHSPISPVFVALWPMRALSTTSHSGCSVRKSERKEGKTQNPNKLRLLSFSLLCFSLLFHFHGGLQLLLSFSLSSHLVLQYFYFTSSTPEKTELWAACPWRGFFTKLLFSNALYSLQRFLHLYFSKEQRLCFGWLKPCSFWDILFGHWESFVSIKYLHLAIKIVSKSLIYFFFFLFVSAFIL